MANKTYHRILQHVPQDTTTRTHYCLIFHTCADYQGFTIFNSISTKKLVFLSYHIASHAPIKCRKKSPKIFSKVIEIIAEGKNRRGVYIWGFFVRTPPPFPNRKPNPSRGGYPYSFQIIHSINSLWISHLQNYSISAILSVNGLD